MKGVKNSSYIVWVTVPLPLILIVVLLIRGATLEGAAKGIRMYLAGEDAVHPITGELLTAATSL